MDSSNQEFVTDIAALQMLSPEESTVFSQNNTCSPSFTCQVTTCSETVEEDEKLN